MKRGKSKNSLKNSKNVKLIGGIFVLLIISAVFVYALDTIGTGFRVRKQIGFTPGSKQIDAHGICKIVYNSNRIYDLFVPTNKSIEWTTFISNYPASYVSVEGCPGCVPQCSGKICGPDGCDGSCGSCPVGQTCNSLGTACVSCIPDCSGKVCGESNGCGGVCTYCESGKRCELTTNGYLCVRDDDPGDETGWCGDNLCNAYEGEDCSNCEEDCGTCPSCGNGICEIGEDNSNCPEDCPTNCGSECDDDLEYCNSLCDAWDCLWWSELESRCISCRGECEDKHTTCILGCGGDYLTCPPFCCPPYCSGIA